MRAGILTKVWIGDVYIYIYINSNLDDSCSDFYIEKDLDYMGGDLVSANNGDGLPVKGGVAECEDLCRAHDDCVGFS